MKRTIIISFAGRGGDRYGYENKYVKIGELLNKHIPNLSMLYLDNSEVIDDELYGTHVINKLSNTILNINKIEPDADIYLMGASAGASAILGVMQTFSCVKKVLVFCPSGNVPFSILNHSLQLYPNELYVVSGMEDFIVPISWVEKLFDIAITPYKHILKVENCDHQFRGESNGRVMSAAALWAFTDQDYDINNGVKLYE